MSVPTASRLSPLFVVFNRSSGRGNRDEVGPAVEAACRAAGRVCELMPVEAPGRLAETAREAVRRARDAGGVVVAAGGDGTINCVVQAVLGSGCAFGVLPRGTFNYFARTHGIPAELDGALRVLLTETAVPVQVGLLNERVFNVNASIGLYSQSLEDREVWKQQFGRSRLVAVGAVLATILRGHRSLTLTIDLHGQTVGLPVAQAIDAGAVARVMVKPVGRWGLLKLLVRGALGRLRDADQVVNFAFDHLVVKNHRFGPRRVKVATDGEVLWMRLPLRFEVAPHPLWLIRPEGLAEERRQAQAQADLIAPENAP